MSPPAEGFIEKFVSLSNIHGPGKAIFRLGNWKGGPEKETESESESGERESGERERERERATSAGSAQISFHKVGGTYALRRTSFSGRGRKHLYRVSYSWGAGATTSCRVSHRFRSRKLWIIGRGFHLTRVK